MHDVYVFRACVPTDATFAMPMSGFMMRAALWAGNGVPLPVVADEAQLSNRTEGTALWAADGRERRWSECIVGRAGRERRRRRSGEPSDTPFNVSLVDKSLLWQL